MTPSSPYRSYSSYLLETYGQKVYRICLDAGFSCPNRDGTLGLQGCLYCSDRGSWGGERGNIPLEEQVRREKKRVRERYGASKFIAYFQAFSNTHAPVSVLKDLYDAVLLGDEQIVGVAIGTRPDCIDREKLELIASYRNERRAVWIEYGLQSAHDRTLELIGRGHDARCFSDAVRMTFEYGIGVMAHVIIGLPGEGRSHVMDTARFIANLPIMGVKLHNLNIVRGTAFERWLAEGKIRTLSLDEYAERVVDCLELLPPDTVIARLTADTPAPLLIEPTWSLNKGEALRRIRSTFERRHTFQGRLFELDPMKRL
jgi:radical SAM protein (TIGR01212 family)